MYQNLRILPAVIMIPLFVSACQTSSGTKTADTDYTRIDSIAVFNETVVGKKLEYKTDHVVTISPNGTWRGDWGGDVIHGGWKWVDGAFCRTINTGKSEDCQQFELSNNRDSLRVIRNRGSGMRFNYRILN
ncbi:hypothetical protein [Sedimenticola selenatireducens]|uniref:hypothetical protein n=1 Tax=Sedimenticola selenatireducens TaxID=191960 RepID=UPI00048EC7A9|nr:hypothetical protein [Sedimenticola selenatireducens]